MNEMEEGLITRIRSCATWKLMRSLERLLLLHLVVGLKFTEVSMEEGLNVKKEPTGQTGANIPTSLLSISNLDDTGDLQEKLVPSPQSCTHTAQDLKKDMVEAGGLCIHQMSHLQGMLLLFRLQVSHSLELCNA